MTKLFYIIKSYIMGFLFFFAAGVLFSISQDIGVPAEHRLSASTSDWWIRLLVTVAGAFLIIIGVEYN